MGTRSLIRSADRAKEDPHQKLFVHFSPETQLFTTHFRRWVAETIRLTYENSSESDLPEVRAHDVKAVAVSIAYYNTPLSKLCGLIRWKSSKVFVRHYLKDMAADTSGPSPGGRTYGLTIETLSSTHCSPPPPM